MPIRQGYGGEKTEHVKKAEQEQENQPSPQLLATYFN